MRAAFKAEFLRQLRSKKWEQVDGLFYEPGTRGRCAAGVAIETAAILGTLGPELPAPDRSIPWWVPVVFSHQPRCNMLAMVDIPQEQYDQLLRMNDDEHMDFRHIADIVELWPTEDNE